MSNNISDNTLPHIVRSGDVTYEYETSKPACWRQRLQDEEQNLLNTKVRIQLPSNSYKHLVYMKELTQKIIKCAEENQQCLESTVYKDSRTGRRWKIVKQSSTLRKIGRFLERQNLSKFVHTVESPAVETYELKRVWTLWDFFLEIYLFFFHKYEEPEYFEPFDSRDESTDIGVNDPFTKLASRAYQDLEHDFVCHDEGNQAGEFTSDYIMIYIDGNLKLIPKEDKQKYKNEAKDALRLCWVHYKNEYGKEKVDYAQYLANFNFQKMMKSFNEDDFQGVTPEHIYRMNILTSGVEHQDVQSMTCKLQKLKQQLEDVDGEKSLQTVFDELHVRNSTIWSNREIRFLIRSVAKFNDKEPGDVTVDDLNKYYKDWDLSWNLHSKLRYTRSVILSIGSRRYSSLEEMLNRHPDLVGVWDDEEREEIINFVRLLTNTNNSKPDDFLKAHQHLQHYVKIASTIQGNELDEPLQDWLENQMNGLVGNKAHNEIASEYLCDLLNIDDPTVGDLFEHFQDSSLKLTAKQYDTIANIYQRDKEELERAYTGRKILKTLNSPYTQADKSFYKPWVDMQEFLQACDELNEDTITDPYTGGLRALSQDQKQRRFNEVAVFFLCKKHLFRPHPREGYRVGELIPAPTDEEGNRRWYRVSRMIASHDGLMNYVLEPVGNDSGLETCVISRSTAGDEYAYESEASVKNDANPIKDPGYLGRRHIDKYLEPIRKKHTIPAWVAYQHAAKKHLDDGNSDDAFLHLVKATTEIRKDVQIKHHKKSLHEIVGEFDAEINDLMAKRVGFARWFNSLWFLKYTPLVIIQLIFRLYTKDLDALMEVVMREAHERSRQRLGEETTRERRKREKQERKDSLRLLKYINKYAPRDHKGNIIDNYQELVDAIGDNIYRNNRGEMFGDYTEKLRDHGYDPKRGGWLQEYNDAEAEIVSVIRRCNQFANEFSDNSTEQILMEWEEYLHEYAISIGENVEVKSTNGLKYAGHSLGGSTAEVETFLTTAGSNRLPIPGSTIHASLYDDPGMAAEDNLSQYQFMLDHLEVMQQLDAKVSVYHSHDYGDIVPLGGTAHLGGVTPQVMVAIRNYIETYNIEESGGYLDWLEDKGIDPDDANESYVENYILQELHETFFITTELKRATSYALEAAIGDYPVKHGTRYESARREQTRILEIANAVGTSTLDVDINENIGLLCSYMLNIFSDDDDDFKTTYPDIYTSPVLCVREFDPVNAQRFLELEHKVSIGGRLTPDEFREHNELIKLGLKKVYSHADRLKQQQSLMRAIRTFQDEDAETVVAEILSFLAEYDKSRSQITKQILISGYSNHLEIIKQIYLNQLEIEADVVRSRAVGGMSITWLDRNQLGEVSGKGIEDDSNVSERYGLGKFFTPSSMQKLRKHVGEFLFPCFKAYMYDEAARNRAIRKKGHGISIFHRNKKSKALVIDEFGGPLAGLR